MNTTSTGSSITSKRAHAIEQQNQPHAPISRKRVWHWLIVVVVAVFSFFNVMSLRRETVDVEVITLSLLASPSNGNSFRLPGLHSNDTNSSLDHEMSDDTNVDFENVFSIERPSSSQLAQRGVSNSSAWDDALQNTVKLLYRDSPPEVLEYWRHQPPPKIYIYDNLPVDFSNVETISQCIDHVFLGRNSTQNWTEKKKNCRWQPDVCKDTTIPNKPKEKMFLSYRHNYNMDVAYLDKFHRYPHQTTDPMEADLFLVPYPHKSHCLCHKNFKHRSSRCAVPFRDIEANVFSNLTFFKPSKNSEMVPYAKERHIFFYGADWLQELPPFRSATSQSITLSLGPVTPCAHATYPERPCGHITLPYLIRDPDFQPILDSIEPPRDFSWTSSSAQRPFFVGAILSSPKALTLRTQFFTDWKKWIGESIGGKPHEIIHMGQRRSGTISDEFMNLYLNSTVCLILPGDGCAQKRFFDALLNGCIPLVPLFPSAETDAPYSFHHDKGCSTRVAYPFAKGTFFQEPSAGFDIMEMVVTFNGTCGLACLRGALEELVSNETVIQEKQSKLRDYAIVVRFGLTSDSDAHVDVFSSLIVRLRHHVWHMLGRTPANQLLPAG